MTETAKKLLDTFDSLPEPERQEVAREILRRAALSEHGPLEDAELLALADEVLLGLVRPCREGAPGPRPERAG